METTTLPEAPASRLPAGHLAAVRKVIRCADAYRSACTVLETYENEYRQWRSIKCLDRLGNADQQMNRRLEELSAAIDAMRDGLDAP